MILKLFYHKYDKLILLFILIKIINLKDYLLNMYNIQPLQNVNIL